MISTRFLFVAKLSLRHAWAVENDLLKAAKDNGETYVDTDSVSRVEVIRVWNKAQEK